LQAVLPLRRMKISRLRLSTALVVVVCCTLTAYQSCIKDQCSKILCNAGVCVSGKCSCPTGYEGSSCEQLWSTKFSGVWHNDEQVQDTSGAVSSHTYDLTVRGNETPGTLLIDNVEGVYDSVVCRITNTYSFQLPAQSSPDSTFRVSGGGGVLDTLTGKVTLNYSFIQNGVTKTARMLWSR